MILRSDNGPVETILELYPTPEERRDLLEMLLRLHPADVETFLQNLLPVSRSGSADSAGPLASGLDYGGVFFLRQGGR